MQAWWKSAIILLAILLASAYVAGTLASSPGDPTPRETIVIREADRSGPPRPSPVSGSPLPNAERSLSAPSVPEPAGPTASPTTPPPSAPPPPGSTATVEEVTPLPEELDDDDDDGPDDEGPERDDEGESRDD